jgi:hypothetical protein
LYHGTNNEPGAVFTVGAGRATVWINTIYDLERAQSGKQRFVLICTSERACPSTMIEIERVQTGVRIEKRLLKVLKGLAELKDLSLGDLLEGIVLHAFEGKAPFSKETLEQIAELKKVYRMSLRADDSHKLREKAK